jgi:NIMA (never in mitosis gene a)-related kinase
MGKREVADTLNEVRLLASIQHHNIVSFYEAFLDKNSTELAVIMEYCGSGDLAGKISRHKESRRYIEEKQVWAYLVQTCDALALLHEKGIMHRDIKGANIFLAEDGSLKLGDMNVSKTTKGNLLKTQIGTPLFMSPETWNNIPYSYPSDMWSVGCLMYELCALRPPFLGNSFPSLKRAILSGKYPSLPSVYSYDLSSVIGRLLRLNPRERPTAREVLNLPEVARWKAKGLECTPSTPRVGNVDLLSTIVVPRKLSMISASLPEANYPSSRPTSPDDMWPEPRAEAAPPRKEYSQPKLLPPRKERDRKLNPYEDVPERKVAPTTAPQQRVPSRDRLGSRDANRDARRPSSKGVERVPSRGRSGSRDEKDRDAAVYRRAAAQALRSRDSNIPGGIAMAKPRKRSDYGAPYAALQHQGSAGSRAVVPTPLFPPRGYYGVKQDPVAARAQLRPVENRHAPSQYKAQPNVHMGYQPRSHNNAYSHQHIVRAGRAAVGGPSWWG